MLNSNNYPAAVPNEMPVDNLPIIPTKKEVSKILQLANNSHYKTLTKISNYNHLSVSYNAYKEETTTTKSANLIAEKKIKEYPLQQRFIYNLNQLQYKPTEIIETFLFEKNSDETALLLANFNVGDFSNNPWLNTPGPIYSTQTKNNDNDGKLLASSNIAGDEKDVPIIFKQPFTQQEVDAILLAVSLNDGDGFCADGNKYWNKTNIQEWWAKSEARIDFIIEGYKTELFTPISSHCTSKTQKQRPVPKNYKLWLDFYRYEMKKYLEWYILKLDNTVVELPELTFDWCLKEKLDKILNTKFLSSVN